MRHRTQPSAVNIREPNNLTSTTEPHIKVTPIIVRAIKGEPVLKIGQRRSRRDVLVDAKALADAIKKNKSRKTVAKESRADESLGGKRNRKTAKRRRAKKSCGFFW